MIGAARRGVRHPRRRDDAGTTLLEVMVAMGIMSVFMAMFTTGIVQVYNATNRTEAIADAQAQVTIAVTRLDTEIRYATAIGIPGCSNGTAPPCALTDPHRFVEYLTIAQNEAGEQHCVQLRVTMSGPADTTVLRRRTWTKGVTAPAAWASSPVLVSGISASNPATSPPQPAAEPFTLLPAQSAVSYQRLRLQLLVRSGAGESASTKQTDVTFTALNSVADSETTDICKEGRASA